MQMKTNKNGVKLLAAVMVLAIALAGVVIVSDDDETGNKHHSEGHDGCQEFHSIFVRFHLHSDKCFRTTIPYFEVNK